MKKLILFFMVFTTIAYAGIISRDQYTSPDSVTVSALNQDFNRIINEFDGNIDSTNIADKSIISKDLADSVNPVVRQYELLGDFTYTGMLPADTANLTSDISAGTSYVSGNRIVRTAYSKTYTASRDTWVFCQSNGDYLFEVVVNGAAQPSTPSGALLLAKVVTDGTQITGVTDYRQVTPPNIHIYSDYRQGCIVSFDTVATVSVGPGEIEFGTASGAGKRRNTLGFQLDWNDLDTGSEAASTYYYVWAYPDPNTTNRFLGKISISSSDATGITNERLIGWFWNDESSNISYDCVGNYKGDGSGVPNIVYRAAYDDITTTSTSIIDVPGLQAKFYSSGRPVKFSYSLETDQSANQKVMAAISVDGVGFYESGRKWVEDAANRWMDLNATIVMTPSAGPHTAKVKWWVDGGTGDLKERVFIIEEQ